MTNRMLNAVLLSLLFLGGISRLNAAVYNESGGLVIMEMENTDSPLDHWQAQSSLSGYSGSGYLQFLENTYETGPATSPLEYTFKVNQAGLYYLHLHCAKETHDGRTDVANDCYVRVEGDYNAGPAPNDSHGDNASLALLQSDTKYFGGAADSWKWEDGELSSGGNGNLDPGGHANKRVAVYDFKAGETYTLVVSGRSKFFRINRILFRHTSVSKSAAQNLSNPESAISNTYDAIVDFPVIDAGDVPYYKDNGNNALAIDASIVSNRTGFARASRTFDGTSGSYDVVITTLTEVDGESTYRLVVNGSVVGSVQNSYIQLDSSLDMQPELHHWLNVSLANGDTIAIESNADTNGRIPENGGTAWSRGRWRQIELYDEGTYLIPKSAFNKKKDLLVAQFDSKPDADDIMAQAALGSMLSHRDLAGVDYYAVAGAIGTQTGTFIDSRTLFTMAFGAENISWTDALSDWSGSVTRIRDKAKAVLDNGGRVWVQEAGQSDITADWVAALITAGVSESIIKANVIVVQHSQWNEDQTTSADLSYVQSKTDYRSIDDGNADAGDYSSRAARGDETPNYVSANASWLTSAMAVGNPNTRAKDLWTEADRIIGLSGFSGSYSVIPTGGVDFSDCVENGWIFEIGNHADSVSSFWDRYVVNTPLIQPPAGRIAYVADGNSPDPDDIGADAVVFGLLAGSEQQDRLVHFSHSCDLVKASNISAADELRRQAYLHQTAGEGIIYFGPYDNLSDYYNCRSNQTAAVANLTAAIDASSASDPLWIIEAGEPDIIGYALQAADPAKIPHVHVVSHHPANDNSGDFFTWAQILAFGVTEHQIGDQNVGLQVLISSGLWDWAEGNDNLAMVWILDQLKYAEADGVVGFQDNKYDCSDAGMIYWWLTGANAGGNSNSTPVEIKAMLLPEDSVPPVVVTTVPQVTNLGEWDVGTTWESGMIPANGINYTSALFLNVNNASSSFGGDSLTMQSGSWLRLRDAVNTFLVSNLIMDGGQVYGATGNNVTFGLDGSISIVSDTLFRAYWNASGPRNLNILSHVSGSANITSLASNDASTHTLFINNAANDFSGTWISQNGTIEFANADAVGSADIEVQDHGKLKILGDWSAYANLTVADAATASVDLGAFDWTVSSLMIGSSAVLEGYTYTVPQLNGLAANAVFTGTGTIKIGTPPQQGVIAGWDTWSSGTAPVASVVAPDVSASATASMASGNWSTTDGDGRGSSDDTTWGTYDGETTPADATTSGSGANFTALNGVTTAQITFTISNTSAEDIVLDKVHFDAVAFRPNAPRTYALNVLAGSDITVGNVFTSADDAITHLGGGLSGHNQHDDIDLSLSGLADHTLESGETAVLQLAFSSGTGSGGGHHLFVDNVAVSRVDSVSQTPTPILDLSMSSGDMTFDWLGGGFKVQSRTNLTEGIWLDVPGGDVPPVNVIPTNTEDFFRLIEQ